MSEDKATQFDPSRGPVRQHDLIMRVGADSVEELAWALRQFADEALRSGISAHGCSGSPSVGYLFSYRDNPEMSHDRYFREVDEWLARGESNG